MSASDSRRRQLLKYAFIYMLITLFCVIFGAVYERFGHGVYSYRMIYAFVTPLVLGAISLFGIALRAKRLPGSWPLLFWNCGTATLTVGLLFHGVLDIYGTTNKWTMVYYIVAAALLCAGIVYYLIFENRRTQSDETDHRPSA